MKAVLEFMELQGDVMEQEQNVVTPLPGIRVIEDQNNPAREAPSSKRTTKQLAKTVVNGLTRLVDGQRQFADEFGLSLHRVFRNSCEHLEGRTSKEVITDWFLSGDEGVQHIEPLIEDLLMHQLALVSVLDDVVSSTLEKLTPEKVAGNNADKLIYSVHNWQQYKSKIREYMENGNIRYQELVMPGFLSNYIKIRESVKRTVEVKSESGSVEQ